MCAAHINSFTTELLHEVTGFCTYGVSVMLGVKADVGKMLDNDFPEIVM